MSNPVAIAARGKGFLPMLVRGGKIASHYGITAGKMDAALAMLNGILQKAGCAATLPVTASALAASPMVALKYHRQGIEMAVHGFQHVDYSALDYEKQLEHIRRSVAIFEHAGIPAGGWRCPYLRWNHDTLKALSASSFIYDSSQALEWDVTPGLDMSGYRRVLAFYRAQSAREYPALPRLVDGLVRIPYCLPDDEALVERLQLSENSMVEVWLALLMRTYEAGELFTLGLHPERVSQCSKALQAVLNKALTLSPCVWIARLDEIASWYLSLGKAAFRMKRETGDAYRVQIDAPAKATILIRAVEVNTATQPWMRGYRSTLKNEFTFRSEKRPVVGISPDSTPALQLFLRHQGYLIEISPDPDHYSIYLNRSVFREEDERPLIAELEQTNVPLIRLSRWPEAARSALSVTGDVDAFTLLDYGRRVLYR